MKEKFLVTGARGMLGAVVVDLLNARGEAVVGTDLPDVDLTVESAVRDFLNTVSPTRVIHCAAYTNVDGAESDEETCRRVNVEMPRLLARVCEELGARMLMVSTDFVFDGRAAEPYAVDAPTGPLGVYGRTKLEGELAAAECLERLQIARTAWMYGPGKRNFVSAMADRLRQGTPLRVVDDQAGCPTLTMDLAERLTALVRLEANGVFHLVNGGRTTWCGLTRKIAELTGYDPESVAAVGTDEYPTPARRPAWSVLDCSRAWELGLEPMRDWTEALSDYLHNHYPDGG